MSVLDFGGGLGSTYFRYQKLLDELNIKWCVVEQKHFIDRGKKTVPEVNFYYNIDEAELSEKVNVLLLSSVLMYLENPYEMFKCMMQRDIFDYIIIDESAFFLNEDSSDSIMLQHVPPSIYNAVYPLHIFGLRKFRDFINQHGYTIQWEWTYSGGQIPIKNGFTLKDTIDKGFLLRCNK